MIHTKQVSFRFTPDVRQALEYIRQRDGIGYSEQMRRAVALWIKQAKPNPPPHARTARKGAK